MTKVIMGASMSLDGYIAGPNESGFDHLFAWHNNGEVEIPAAHEQWTFRPGRASEPVVREYLQVGAIVCGRRLFDLTQGWGGHHPLGAPVFVVTHNVPTDWPHPDAPFTFVTDGVESAVRQAQKAAGDSYVSIAAGNVGRQALEAGLVDEVRVELVPVFLGGGTRFADDIAGAPVALGNPRVIEGDRVTHLQYPVIPQS
ncbi:dihydrofolate reductase family protein [Actinomadura barringtoniae]|uniref:Dihydrofolate reductase family protein n=1 Tax=Actinomadura barringtoniae TaxID=1427535 RepID=A0A939PFS2_9ACTN|nr:dihydrofolate reductase family protein [Actinomadura barringtoniae]MBO2448919.1 dihydrofolate reductase family protein [Actinomadura barringtoniae]